MNVHSSSDMDAVIQAYADIVYRLAYTQVRSKTDADDIFQEVFLRYLRKAPIFESEAHRKAWLIRVTINCSKRFWTSAWNRKTVPLEDQFSFPQPEIMQLDEALSHLPSKYRTVIHLYYYEGYSTDEIAGILHTKPSTIRSQLTRARNKLKQLLKGDYDV